MEQIPLVDYTRTDEFLSELKEKLEEVKLSIAVQKSVKELKREHRAYEKQHLKTVRQASTEEIRREIKKRQASPHYDPVVTAMPTEDILSELERRLLVVDPLTGRMDVQAMKSFVKGSRVIPGEEDKKPPYQHIISRPEVYTPRLEERVVSRSQGRVASGINDDLGLAIDEVRQDPSLRDNPFLAYFVAEKIEGSPFWRKSGLKGVSEEVAQRTGVKLASSKSTSGRIAYEVFFKLQDLLKKDIDSGEYKYFRPEGLYLAAKELEKEGAHLNVPATGISLRSTKDVAALVQRPESGLEREWKARHIDMKVDDIEALLGFMKEKYAENADAFFKRYGSAEGTHHIADDIAPHRKIKTNLRKVHSLVNDGEMVGRLLNVQDDRFRTEWDTQVVALSPSEINSARSILQEAYKKDKAAFYATYGSRWGSILLSKSLAAQGLEISPARISSVLVNKEKAKHTAGIEDKDFEKKWRVKSFDDELPIFDKTIDVLKRAYKDNSDAFFKRYGAGIGVYNLGLDMAESFDDLGHVSLNSLTRIAKDSSLLESMLGVTDERFRTHWHPDQMRSSLVDTRQAVDFLQKAYKDDPASFFERYGSTLGLYHLMKDLGASPDFTHKPQSALKNVVSKGNKVADLLGVSDPRFSTWKPRSLTVNADQVDDLVDVMKTRYHANPERFFERYGCEEGLLNLSSDVEKEKGIMVATGRIGSVVKDPRAVEQLLQVRDDRFHTLWNPRSIQAKRGMPEKIGGFLRSRYEEDSLRFFLRYGSDAGQYALLQDLREEGIKIPAIQLNSIVNSPSLVAKLSGIPQSELKDRWECRSISVDLDNIERMGTIMRRAYEEDDDLFFERFGNRTGAAHMIDCLREEDVNPNPHSLSQVMRSGELVSTIMGVEDDRFLTDWKVTDLAISNRQLTPTIDFLKREYFTSPEEFFKRYGVREGAYNLAVDLDKKGLLLSRGIDRLDAVLDRQNIQEVLGIRDQRFQSEWRPTVFAFNLDEFRALATHLREQYKGNSAQFFASYGQPMRTVILSQEAKKLGVVKDPRSFSTVLRDGEFVSGIVGVKDSRFESEWAKRSYYAGLSPVRAGQRELEEVTKIAVGHMAQNCDLPYLGETITPTQKENLVLRNGLRSVNYETARHVAELFARDNGKAVLRNMERAVDKDKKNLSALQSLSNTDDVNRMGAEEATNLAGHLLYSFDPNVRTKAGHKVLALYTPVFDRMAAGRKFDTQNAWEMFTRYCENFDMYGLRSYAGVHNKIASRPISLRVPGMINAIMNGEYKEYLATQTMSLDSDRGDEGESSYHEVVA